MSVNELVEQWLLEYASRHGLHTVLNGRSSYFYSGMKYNCTGWVRIVISRDDRSLWAQLGLPEYCKSPQINLINLVTH